MITKDDPIIKERCDLLDPKYVEFAMGDFATSAASQFGAKLGLDEEGQDVFGNGVSLYLLFFIDKNELISFIVENCSIDKIKVGEVVDLIAGLLPPNFTVEHHKAFQIFSGAMQKQTSSTETSTSIPTPPKVSISGRASYTPPSKNTKVPTPPPPQKSKGSFNPISSLGSDSDKTSTSTSQEDLLKKSQ